MAPIARRAAKRNAVLVPDHMLMWPDQWWHPILVLDVDGCLLDWRTDFCRFVNQQWAAQGQKRRLEQENMSIFLFAQDPRSGMTPREFGVMFDKFCEQTLGGFGDLKPIPGAIEAVQQIRVAGIETMVMTDVPGPLDRTSFGQMHASGNAQRLRERQLLRLNVVDTFDDIKFVPGHDKARQMCGQTRPIPAAVDDRGSIAVNMAQDFGLKCFLMEQPYNGGIDCHGVERCADLASAVPRILRFYDELEAAGKLRPRLHRAPPAVAVRRSRKRKSS